jgi:uncharacterized membrane protein YczE
MSTTCTRRLASLYAGIVLFGVSVALMIAARLGLDPWDVLHQGLGRRGWPIRRVRTSIELAGLAAGWLLGGTVGIGTLLYAVSIGPLVHVLLPRLTIAGRANQEGDQT